MLKIIHVLSGVAALILSFVPSLTGGMPFLVQPEALCLLFIGLLNVQFASNAQLTADGRNRPVLLGASVLLIAAAVIQAVVLLAPVVAFAGRPATLASLVLALISVLLQLATTQSKSAVKPHRSPNTPRKTQQTQTSVPGAGRERGTVKWFNTSKGFGFISRDSGDDVFVHFRAIRGEGHRVLVEGQRVEFTIMMRDKGLQAEDVVAAQPGQ